MTRHGVTISRSARRDGGLSSPLGASEWLVGRMRLRTPSGAVEYLTTDDPEERGARVKMALRLNNLFREFFPRQYRYCSAPVFSLKREHEFYKLVNYLLFPLDLTPVIHNRDWMYPFIPVRCQQPHDWFSRDYSFDELEPPFQLVHALFDVDNDGFWEMLTRTYNLPGTPRPVHPRRSDGEAFTRACVSEDSPLKHLPVAIVMQSYGTGSVWLDCPPMAMMGMEWKFEDMLKLKMHWIVARKMFTAIAVLSEWFTEAPKERFGRAVELWNATAK